MSIARQFDRRSSADMKGLVHNLLEGQHNNIPSQRGLGKLAWPPVNAVTYSFEPTLWQTHKVSYGLVEMIFVRPWTHIFISCQEAL